MFISDCSLCCCYCWSLLLLFFLYFVFWYPRLVLMLPPYVYNTLEGIMTGLMRILIMRRLSYVSVHSVWRRRTEPYNLIVDDQRAYIDCPLSCGQSQSISRLFLLIFYIPSFFQFWGGVSCLISVLKEPEHFWPLTFQSGYELMIWNAFLTACDSCRRYSSTLSTFRPLYFTNHSSSFLVHDPNYSRIQVMLTLL